MDESGFQVARLVLALGALAVLSVRRLRPQGARGKAVLLGLGLLGALAYANFGTLHGGRFLHVWDAYHYYVGAKYFPELGYQELYKCTAEADLEAGVPGTATRGTRELATNRPLRVYEALSASGKCRARFAPHRWESFTHDVAFFRESVDTQHWRVIQLDHGYNATPAWTWVGHHLANLAPASDVQLTLWALVDPLLLLGAAALLAWAFSLEVSVLFLLVLGTWFPSSFAWTGGALLRADWLFLSILGVCLLKRAHPVAAGVAVALAGGLRLFPVLLFVGPFLMLLVHGRRGPWVRFLGSGALTLALGLGLFTASPEGRETFRAFLQNTAKHADTRLTNHMGLRTVLSYRVGESAATLREPGTADPWKRFREQRRANARQLRPLQWAMVAGFALALLARFRRRPTEPWEALSLSWLFVPLLLELTSYYLVLVAALAPLAMKERRFAMMLSGLCAGSQVLAMTSLPDDLLYLAQSAWLLVCVALALYLPRPGEELSRQSVSPQGGTAVAGGWVR